MYNGDQTQTGPCPAGTPTSTQYPGSFRSIRSPTPTLQTPSSFCYEVKPSVLRATPTAPPDGTCHIEFKTNKKEFPPSIQGITNNCNTCYSGYFSPFISPSLRAPDSTGAWNSLKYYDPLYFYPQKEIKERRKKLNKKILDKYKKFLHK